MRSRILAIRSCQLNTSGPDENVYQINYSRYCIKLVDQKYALQDQILLSKKRNVLPNFSYSLWAVSTSSGVLNQRMVTRTVKAQDSRATAFPPYIKIESRHRLKNSTRHSIMKE